MNATLTIDQPEDVRSTLGKAAREDGLSESAFAAQALEEYLQNRRAGKAASDKPDRADIDALLRTMEKIRLSAKRRGLTPEILESILKDD